MLERQHLSRSVCDQSAFCQWEETHQDKISIECERFKPLYLNREAVFKIAEERASRLEVENIWLAQNEGELLFTAQRAQTALGLKERKMKDLQAKTLGLEIQLQIEISFKEAAEAQLQVEDTVYTAFREQEFFQIRAEAI